MPQCPRCGSNDLKELGGGRYLCEGCGVKLKVPGTSAAKACPICGATDPRETFTCPSCGLSNVCVKHRIGSGCEACTCPWCEGTGKVKCPFCHNGDCPACHGTGTVTCKECDGTGHGWPFGFRTCKRCNGRGVESCSSNKCANGKCTVCSGKGYKMCDACQGTGRKDGKGVGE